MNKQEPNPAPAQEQAEGSRENVNVRPHHKNPVEEFEPNQDDLDGKTDSGPEPDVFGREVPPQD